MASKSSEGNRALLQTEDSHDDDEAEETLSLSDLPLYSSSSSINHHAAPANRRHNQNHCRHQEDFEFFSEDFTASTRPMPPDSIVFCGKIIHPYREPPEQDRTQEKNRRGGLFQWKSDSWLTKSNPKKVSTTVRTSVSVSPSPSWSPPPATDKYEFSVEKVSVQYSSKSTSYGKWYLFKFGLGSKLPVEMELRDIKTRQSRRRGGGIATFRTRNGHAGETVDAGDRVKGSGGLWGLLTSLRCRTSRT